MMSRKLCWARKDWVSRGGYDVSSFLLISLKKVSEVFNRELKLYTLLVTPPITSAVTQASPFHWQIAANVTEEIIINFAWLVYILRFIRF